MARFAADVSFNNILLRELRGQIPDLDVVRLQDTDLWSARDPLILAWAAREGRILLTQDVRTMPKYAYARLAAGEPVAGVVVVPQSLAIGSALEDLLILIECSREEDWTDPVRFLPL
jgi:hypothetical protein